MISISLDRMFGAMEQVRQRLLRAVAALESAGLPYAVVGGHAVAAWVSTVDPAGVRNTRDVDILIRRQDLEAAKIAFEASGFVYRRAAGIDLFLEGPESSARDAIHLVFSGEKVREHEPAPNPEVDESTESEHFQVISLEALVRIKLTAFRLKDQVHLVDLLDLGLIDESWCERLQPELADRLRALINDPNAR
ncbi:MAG TPA: hypothetical protein VK934_10705 [Fimbriimonas sp.]|nr:hypothetical protein [Fimbriimonas sp.]